MQDLVDDYVDKLNKFRDAFHEELSATAQELSKAIALYASRSEAALASYMEKVSARGVEFEASAVARLNQFRGLPANGVPPDAKDGIDAVAERAVADGLRVENDEDRKPQPGRVITLVKSEPAASSR